MDLEYWMNDEFWIMDVSLKLRTGVLIYCCWRAETELTVRLPATSRNIYKLL